MTLFLFSALALAFFGVIAGITLGLDKAHLNIPEYIAVWFFIVAFAYAVAMSLANRWFKKKYGKEL